MKFIKALVLFALVILISSCMGNKSETAPTNDAMSINSTPNIILPTHKQRQYTTWLSHNNIKHDITANTSWSSSNPSVATIDNSGMVVTHNVGTTIILAKYNNSYVSSKITVSSSTHKVGQSWPEYLAMGTISANEVSGSNAEPTNVKVDAVFTYNGASGDGDPGKIETPYKIFDMFDMASEIEKNVPSAVVNPVLVEYQWDLSGGWNTQDVVEQSHLTKHLFNLMFLANVLQNNAPGLTKTNGTILLNPDLLGYIANTDRQKAVESLDIHVERSLNSAYCMMTRSFNFGQYSGCTYNNKPITVTGNVNDLLISLLQAAKGNTYAASQSWASCVESVVYPACESTQNSSNVPALSNNFNGWVQAQNWSIKKFGADVQFGWHEDLSATPSGNWWVHGDSDSATQYANLVLNEMSLFHIFDGLYQPDFIYFDRYGADDYNSSVQSLTNAEGIFYNDAAWTNVLTMVKLVSESLLSSQGIESVPVMLWQIPAAHIPASNESLTSPLTEGSAPDYFFGDPNISPNLSNIAPWVESGVGKLIPASGGNYGQCQNLGAIECLIFNHFNWAHQDNVEIDAAINAHVFAILWGAGGATGVWVVPGVTLTDNGWMINTINHYYTNLGKY